MARGLKLTFYAYAVVTLVIGGAIYLKPSLLGLLVGDDGDMTRTYGAVLLALALASWLSARASHWSEVRIIVLLNIVLSALSSVGALWGLFFRGAEPVFWVGVAAWILFGALWAYHYFNHIGET